MKTPSQPLPFMKIADHTLAAEMLASILGYNQFAIYSEDLEGVITSWGDGAENIFGYSAQEIIGKPAKLLLPANLHDEEAALNAQIHRGELVSNFLTKRLAKDGKLIDLSITIAPIFSVNGVVIGASSIARDVTSHLLSEHKLNFSEEIIDGANDAIIGKDLNGIILSWNKGAENIFGYSPEEAVGSSIQILMPPDRLNEENQILKLIGQGDTLEHFETVRKCKDGSLINISITTSAIKDSFGKIIGASQVARDVTSQRKLQRELLEQDRVSRALEIEKKEHQKYTHELAKLNEKLKMSLVQTIELARELGEMRDPYTSGHEKGVGDLAAAIANELGLEKEFQEGMRVAGYLHDIGKTIIPVEILVKPSALSPIEYELMKQHVEAGFRVLNKITFPWDIAREELEHHERLDGSGYPHGLKDGEISIGGRILAVADVINAMTNHRPYRPAIAVDAVLAELQRGAGVLYDKAVVDACVSLIKIKGYQIKDEPE